MDWPPYRVEMEPDGATAAGSLTLDLQPDAATFLQRAGSRLATEPVLGTVVATMAHRQIREIARGELPAADNWWLTVTDASGDVVGLGMCQPPSPDRRIAYVSALTDSAAAPLAAALVDRGDLLDGMNGALPAVERFADEWQALTGDAVEVDMPTRLYELDALVTPAATPGELRAPRQDEYGLVAEWLNDFHAAAALQGGRPAAETQRRADEDDVAQRVADDRVWLWVVDGHPVHLTGHNPPSFGVARIGPVYTPTEHRGHGYAAAAVAAVSRRLQVDGARVCLFTDRSNPVSNPLYQRLGYRPVVDMVNLGFRR